MTLPRLSRLALLTTEAEVAALQDAAGCRIDAARRHAIAGRNAPPMTSAARG